MSVKSQLHMVNSKLKQCEKKWNRKPNMHFFICSTSAPLLLTHVSFLLLLFAVLSYSIRTLEKDILLKLASVNYLTSEVSSDVLLTALLLDLSYTK